MIFYLYFILPSTFLHHQCQSSVARSSLKLWIRWRWGIVLTLVHCAFVPSLLGHAMAILCGVYGEQTGTWTEFYRSISVLPCLCHSTNAPHLFFCLSLLLYPLRNFQF